MLKLTSLVLGLVTAMSLAPAAQALPRGGYNPVIAQTLRDRHSQVVVVRVTPQMRREAARRQLELARERAAQARWKAKHPHRKYVKQHAPVGYQHNNGYYYGR